MAQPSSSSLFRSRRPLIDDLGQKREREKTEKKQKRKGRRLSRQIVKGLLEIDANVTVRANQQRVEHHIQIVALARGRRSRKKRKKQNRGHGSDEMRIP